MNQFLIATALVLFSLSSLSFVRPPRAQPVPAQHGQAGQHGQDGADGFLSGGNGGDGGDGTDYSITHLNR